MKQNLLTRWRGALSALLVMVGLLSSLPANALLYDYDKTTMTATVKGNKETGEVVIPETVELYSQTYTVTEIGSFTNCTGMTSITIPNTVTTINWDAFAGCSSLTSITIPSSVTVIGSNAFARCTALETIIYNAKNCAMPGNAAAPFYNRSSVKNVTIGKEVEVIPSQLFEGCDGIETVIYNAKNCKIPNTNSYPPFYKKSSIKYVTIGNEVEVIPANLFSGCDAIYSVIYNAKNCTLPSIASEAPFFNKSSIKYVTIGNEVEAIPSSLFPLCYGLSSVNIPNAVTSIGESAFYGCTGLSSVTIGKSVTSIGNLSFQECSGLTSITLPNSVTSIGDLAFYGCSSMKSVTLGESVTSIGNNAFAGCISLASINLPNSITEIGVRSFDGCSSLTSVALPNSVAEIGPAAFSGCRKLPSVVIPNSVTSIKYDTFQGCSGLTSVTIGESVTTIGSQAFSGCSGLTSVIIPNSVTSIDDCAFSGCSGLSSVTFGESVTTIGSQAFDRCGNLRSILAYPVTPPNLGRIVFYNVPTWLCNLTVPSGSIDAYKSADQWKNFQNIEIIGGSYTYGGLDYKVISSSECKLVAGDYSSLSEIFIPTTTVNPNDGKTYTPTAIDDGAFNSCTGINLLTINCDLMKLAGTSFGGLSTKVKALKISEQTTSIPANAFKDWTSLISVNLPKTVTSINDNAFSGCAALPSIEIPVSVATIGSKTFDGCSSLETVVYNAKNCVLTANSIDDNPFNNKTSIKYVTLGDEVDVIPNYLFSGCSEVLKIDIPTSVTSIGEGAFYQCFGLTELRIPENVTQIGHAAFWQCKNVKTFYYDAIDCAWDGLTDSDNNALPLLVENLVVGSKVKVIPAFFASECPDLTSVSFGESVTTVGKYAFYNCSSITSVNTSNSVTSIGEKAFYGCSGLTSAPIGNSVATIGESAFCGCSSMPSVVIPNSVTSIDYSTFQGCSGLTSITIPSSVNSIAGYAFSGCSGLKTIVANPVTPPSLGSNVFNGVPTSSCVLTVPSGSIDAYKSADQWKNFKNIEMEGGSYTYEGLNYKVISSSECKLMAGDYSSLSEIILPATTVNPNNGKTYILTSIDEGAFSNCASVETLTLNCDLSWFYGTSFGGLNTRVKSLEMGDQITSLPDNAFTGWTLLNEVTISNSVASIGNNAFNGCNAIETVTYNAKNCTLPSTIYGPFYNKSSIKNVTIGDGVEVIPYALFCGCSGITGINIPNSVTSIEDAAFQLCKGLTSLTIGSYVASIGEMAFSNCTALKSIISNPVTPPTLGNKAFYNVPTSSCVLTVPGESLYAYKSASQWRDFVNIEMEGGSYTYEGLNYKVISSSECKLVAGDYSSLSEIILPATSVNSNNEKTYTLTAIEDNVFSNCTSLEFVTLNCDLTNFAGTSFGGLGTIAKTLILGEQITSVPDNAFKRWTAMKEVTVGKSVISFGDNVFANCSNLVSVFYNAPNANIPSGYVGPFYGKTSITKVTFGDNVENIPAELFANCSNIQTVNFPAGEFTMGHDALAGTRAYGGTFIQWNVPNCVAAGDENGSAFGSDFTEILFTPEVENIPAYIAYNVSGLKTVTIPTTVKSLGEKAFVGSGLTAVYAENSSPATCAADAFSGMSTTKLYVTSAGLRRYRNQTGWKELSLNSVTESVLPEEFVYKGVRYRRGETGICSVVAYATGFVYADGDAISENPECMGIKFTTTAIESKAFRGSIMTKITIPASITKIGTSAFAVSTALKSVIFEGNDVTTTEDTFNGCTALESVTLPANLTTIGNNDFLACKSLQTIEIPSTVKSIGEYAFQQSGLTSITVPESVTSIGKYAFSVCPDLVSAILPETITAIPENIFWRDSSLEEFEISDKVTAIGIGAFKECSALTTITIPQSVTSIGQQAFYQCGALTDVHMYHEKAPTMSSNSFDATATIEILPFYTGYTGCGATIKTKEFEIYQGLKLSIPDTKEGVSSLMVSDDNEHGYVAATQVPEDFRLSWGPHEYSWKVESLASEAFNQAFDIPSIVLPSSLKSLGDKALYDLISLESLVCLAEVPPTCGADAIHGCNFEGDTGIELAPATLYVPAGSVDAYKGADQWNQFTNIVGIETVSVDNVDYMAYGNDVVILGSTDKNVPVSADIAEKPVTIGGVLQMPTAIGARAFAGTEFADGKLTLAGTKIKTIFNGAFEGAIGLRYIDFGYGKPLQILNAPSRAAQKEAGVKTIGAAAFKNCPDLETVFIPATITSIGSQAFAGTPIKNVVIANPSPNPDDYELSIGSDIFGGCDLSEATLYVPEESLDAYQAADQWKAFGNFATLEDASDILTGIDDIIADGDGDAYGFDPDDEIEYYNLNGIRVSGENLQPGIYILRQGNKTAKILVK